MKEPRVATPRRNCNLRHPFSCSARRTRSNLAVALKRLFVIFPQGDAPAEREFLGRKIFSVPVPPLPFLMSGPSRPFAPRTLSCAASGGYVAMSTDTSLLEEYLRSSESQAKALREKPGLLEAAQKVGGMGTGLLRV